MEKGDTFIDGGNSNYKDTQRAMRVDDKGSFCGLRQWARVGSEEGYSLMMAATRSPSNGHANLRDALRPRIRDGTRRTFGAGHFVKMVHNGIEYGMMQAYAEGFSIMHAKTPLNLDLPQISKICRRVRWCVPAGFEPRMRWRRILS